MWASPKNYNSLYPCSFLLLPEILLVFSSRSSSPLSVPTPFLFLFFHRSTTGTYPERTSVTGILFLRVAILTRRKAQRRSKNKQTKGELREKTKRTKKGKTAKKTTRGAGRGGNETGESGKLRRRRKNEENYKKKHPGQFSGMKDIIMAL